MRSPEGERAEKVKSFERSWVLPDLSIWAWSCRAWDTEVISIETRK